MLALFIKISKSCNKSIFSHLINLYCRYYTHCHHCLSRCYNLIPCSKCPIAQYCSERCKNLDWKFAHCTECQILPLLSNLLNVDKNKIRMLTKIVRLVIVATANGTAIQELRQDIKLAESNPGFYLTEITHIGTYLETHIRL